MINSGIFSVFVGISIRLNFLRTMIDRAHSRAFLGLGSKQIAIPRESNNTENDVFVTFLAELLN